MADNNIYKQQYDLLGEGITIELRTTGQYLPAHWHHSLELLYLLNGSADVYIEGTLHRMIPGECIVIDTNQIHEVQCSQIYMMLFIHIDDALIQALMDNKRNFQILCSRQELTEDRIDDYFKICDLLRLIPPLYMQTPKAYRIKGISVTLDILYLLITRFSYMMYKDDLPEPTRNQQRMQEIVSYIDEHYKEPISLEQIADHFGLNREYFSRMFRKNIGIPFTQHVNHVRLSHIYHDICATDEPIMEIIEKHGFTNYKLFSRMFREMYGGSPREIRRQMRENNE